MSDLKRFEHLKIQLEAIKSATNNFSESHCIGKGGFGKVYMGELVHSGGHSTVALKCLDRAFGQGDREFWNEILMLSLYKHKNIVSLLGFCDDGGEKILVYKYASKRGLDLYIKSKELTWVRRLNICIGAACGLATLHDSVGIHHRVLHRDIKSSNILLDENWNAMIADFGLSKFCPANLQYSLMFSNPVGTFGYWDPLYIESGILTKESDVYSFGVVLFEVLCGRLCTDNNDKSHSFTELVRKHYKQNNLNEIVFGDMKDEINASSLKAFSTIAYQCLKRDRMKRPLMNEIVTTLKTALEYQVKKEKMGDRITALQQLVSPFGKTDTASVLFEAIEYIKFLHEQVSVLSTPYMKIGAAIMQPQQTSDKPSGPRQGLRGRGLCLVPLSSTFPVTHETTVDFWTPTFGGTFR